MLEILLSGGWLMLPILICSVVALAIIGERFHALSARRVISEDARKLARRCALQPHISAEQLQTLRADSPLGRVLAAGLANRGVPRDVLREAIEEAGRHEVHGLNRFLNALGTIAAITPLLGLLGTVVGMISVFATITSVGVGSPNALAGGISQALMTTAAGLFVAIPALVFSRYFHRRVDDLVVTMEKEALQLVHTLLDPDTRKAGRTVRAEATGRRRVAPSNAGQ
ncbi:MAG: MotA/TolQ/ExbB proton channel family protein [Pseudomonadota bacterium]